MPQVVIVTPALRAENNGNWQTAWRWQRHLAGVYRARIVKTWPDTKAAGDDAMIALHARRSAAAIAAWSTAHGDRGLALALTGTDLYRDIERDADARHSLERARYLVTLQALGPMALPPHLRAKARVIYQSAAARRPLAKSPRHLRAVMVGHLRDEKSPETLFATARLLASRRDIHLDHIGAGLDPALAEAARSTMAANARYRWFGGLPHEATRRRIQRAHLLIHASRMEGGAHVIIEAVVSGTPVLASRIDGNIGMLGDDYAGYFPWGDAPALAELLVRCREDPAFLPGLMNQCGNRASRFAPAAERAALATLAQDLLTGS